MIEHFLKARKRCLKLLSGGPLNIQPVVIVRGLKRQQDAALTNFVGCFFLLYLISFFSSLALNDLAGPLARKS